MTVSYLFKKLSRNKKNKKTKNRKKKQIGLTRKNPKQYKQYKKIFKGGYPPKYVEVLKKYYYIFGNYVFDSILETKIFNNSDHIDTLILYLNEKTKKTTNKIIDNESQVTEILKPALTQFVDDVVRHNQGEESNIIKLALFTMSTKTILNTLLGPITIKKILEVSPPDKLIETFISDLVILKMKLEDKEKAKADAKADAKVEAKDAEPAKKTPQKSTSEKKQKTKNTNQKNKENVQRINSDDHFGIMAAKPKSRKPIYRRKRRETHRYGQNYS
jgi:hypothetical protein